MYRTSLKFPRSQGQMFYFASQFWALSALVTLDLEDRKSSWKCSKVTSTPLELELCYASGVTLCK